MIELFFDESGNTSSLRIRKEGNKNYDTQPYFAYGALSVKQMDKKILKRKYNIFCEKFKSLKDENGEIKGNILLTRNANEALEYFIENFIDDNMYINVYSKDYYIATLYCLLVFGQKFQYEYIDDYYSNAEILSQSEEFVLNFINYLESENKQDFDLATKTAIEIFKEAKPYEENLISLLQYMVDDDEIIKLDDVYDIVTHYYDDRLKNVVNIPCFGELNFKIMEKIGMDNISNIHIDQISLIDEEIKTIFTKVYKKDLIIKDSYEDKEFLDIADNIVSIFLKLYRIIVEQLNVEKRDYKKSWEMENFIEILSKMSTSNIKLTVPSNEYSLVLATYDLFKDNLELNANNLFRYQLNRLENWSINNKYGAEKLKSIFDE